MAAVAQKLRRLFLFGVYFHSALISENTVRMISCFKCRFALRQIIMPYLTVAGPGFGWGGGAPSLQLVYSYTCKCTLCTPVHWARDNAHRNNAHAKNIAHFTWHKLHCETSQEQFSIIFTFLQHQHAVPNFRPQCMPGSENQHCPCPRFSAWFWLCYMYVP